MKPSRCPMCKREKKIHKQTQSSRYCIHCWETIEKPYEFK